MGGMPTSGDIFLDYRLAAFHLFDLHLQIEQVEVEHQTQIII
jgi:hypothetical protein